MSTSNPRMGDGCTRESPRCEFWAQGEDYVRPPCCTQHLKDLLFFTHDLLERHAIPHWLDFGALLGAVRGGEFIPWDSDVDFGILSGDLPRLRALEDEVARAGHWLDMRDPFVWRIHLSKTNIQHADLFPWREEEGLLKMHWPGFTDDSWSFPRRFLDGAKPVKLYGQDFPAPAPLKEFLARHRYGPDYYIPQRPKRVAASKRMMQHLRAFVVRQGVRGLLVKAGAYEDPAPPAGHLG